MPVDTTHENVVLRKIGFGSCSNQKKDTLKPVYERLSQEDFDLWIWSGDAVYAKGLDLDSLRSAFQQLHDDGSYGKFASKVGRVVGTWDDHDLGVNDGGMYAPQLADRQDLYLDFLGLDRDDPKRQRHGVYSSHDFGHGDETVRVILLDTRSGRGDYPLSFIGAMGTGSLLGKPSPVLAAAMRTFCALTGLSKRFAELGWSNSQMLDEAQWKWLEDQLMNSPASVNVLVSSVQVLTRTPSVEAWGHFPLERQRLLRLLNKSKPRGLLLVSGDVHIGIASDLDDTPGSAFVEATSSGLTHTCTAGGIPHWVCSLVWNAFETPKRKSTMLLSRNFGSIDIDWKSRTFSFSLNSITENTTMTFNRSMDPLLEFNVDKVPGTIPDHADAILAGSFLSLFLLMALASRLFARCRPQRAVVA